MTEQAVALDDLRPLMFSIAYRMLGSVAEAEDVVQDAFLRMHTSAPEDIRSREAYATTVTTRLAIDTLRSARRRREHYVGPWLPEPLVETAEDADPAWRVEMDETVSVAFLVVLETLSPVERAVFLLREVFDYGYADIAAVVGKNEANCRQLLHRARRRLEDDRCRLEPSAVERDRLAEAFFTAVREGDLTGLEATLADDVELYGDGGGKAPAARTPVRGPVQVGRFLLGLVRQASRHGFRLQRVRVNGHPGAEVFSPEGDLLGVLALGVRGGRVVSVHNQVNPDKLGHLGPVGDLTVLLSGDG
ncbi:MAG: RNA polymerase sigma-70 factor [Actinomycetes bacterium]